MMVLLGLAGATEAAVSGKKAKKLPDCPAAKEKIDRRFTQWLDNVELLLSIDELNSFLCLNQDYQRDAFIEEFWKARDPYPETLKNELKERWELWLLEVSQLFGGLGDPRAEFYLLNGPPPIQSVICDPRSASAMEAWFYGFDSVGEATEAVIHSRLRAGQYSVLFHRRNGVGALRMWLPGEELATLSTCNFTELAAAVGVIKLIQRYGDGLGFAYERFIYRKLEPPHPVSDEWLLTFDSYSTELDAETPLLDVETEVSFPGRKGQRTIVQLLALLDPTGATLADVLGTKRYAFELIGEVLRTDQADQALELFDKFRYRFEVAEDQAPDKAPLAVQRYLRPGSFRLVIRIDDLNGPAAFRAELDFEVPKVDHLPAWDEAELEPIFAEANQRLSSGEPSIKIVIPTEDLKSGYLRFETATTGEIDSVSFSLDEKPILTKRKAPYSVDLDLGHLPKSQMLRAIAYDAEKKEIASDAYLINASPYRFAVRLISPIAGGRYRSSVRVVAETTVPEDDRLERVEIFLNDDLVATLYQPPLTQVIDLPDGAPLTVVRAVAHLADGTAHEDTVIINGPATLEEVNIDFVELYTTVSDAERRPLLELERSAFRILEDGVEQEIARFERVENTPIRGVVLLDVSASMEDRLVETTQAAAQFFQQVVTERDELAVVTFNDRPHMAATFTSDQTVFGEGLLGLRAERGTALYDSLIFTLYQLNGLPGQRVLILLSDGQDEHSRFAFEDALEYAQRSQATIYAIGLALEKNPKKKDRVRKENPRKVLATIAAETGGRSFFVDDVSGLASIYNDIAEELRAKYLIAYQSTNTVADGKFRQIVVEVDGKGATAQTIRGYYP